MLKYNRYSRKNKKESKNNNEKERKEIKMKKKILITFVIAIISIYGICISNVKALTVGEEPEQASIEFNLTNKVTVTEGEKAVKLKISLGKFKGIKEDVIMGYQAKISYDDTIFESVKVKGLNGWTVTYSENTKKLVADPKIGVENTEIAEIEITLKEGIKAGSTIVKLTDILLTDDTNDFTYNKEAIITIEEKKEPIVPEPDDGNNNNNQNEGQEQKEDITNKEETQTQTPATEPDPTVSKEKLPSAGIGNIIFAIIVISIISIMLIIRYKSIETK